MAEAQPLEESPRIVGAHNRHLLPISLKLIAAAVAESLHAPFIGHYKASTAKVEPGKPAADPFLQLPATTVRPSAEYGFSGVTVPNGSVNKGR